ncbi:MAG TPA: pilus assembly protein PilP [Vicinamibacterales bacterium]|jgi:type IV pilus assembly protein PilP
MTERRDASRVRPVLLALLVSGGAALGQAQPPVTTPKTPAAAPAPASAGDAYHYDPTGRRDPFVSLMGRTTQTASDPRIEGLPGIAVQDLRVTGILQSGGEYVAMVEAPDGRTWLAHVHDRLRDGSITKITMREVILAQSIADPLSPVKTREVRKAVGGATK